MNPEEQKNIPNDKVTEIEENQKKKDYDEIGVKRKIMPLINYKLSPLLSSSIINYLAIGISLAVFGCDKINKFKFEQNRKFYAKYYLVSGIILYISGLFDWYDGKELLYLADFVLSFFFMTQYLNEIKPQEDLGNQYFIRIKSSENEKLHGTFYVMLFFLFLCITISYKNKGKFYIINYFALFVGFIFLFLYDYFEKDWIKKTYSYMFIAIGGLFWLTALLKMIDNFMNNYSISFLLPSD